MYKFSAPMPYTIEDINKLLDINKQVEKSKITSLYACVPRDCEVFTGFEQARNFSFNNKDWNFWKNLIEHVLSKNCNFIYLLNSPRPLNIESTYFHEQLEKLDMLLNELKKIGVKKLRVGSVQLMSYIGKHYSDFEILASTSIEYKTIWEYQNFIYFHPEVKQIVPSHDINKNFKLLSNIRKQYKNIEIELMVNEGCLQGCPHRMLHQYSNIDKNTIVNNDFCLSGLYTTYFCFPLVNKYPIHSLVIGTHIFPWEIEEYEKINIHNFKFVGRDGFHQNFQEYIDGFSTYLRGIDDIKNIENNSLSDFIHHLQNNQILKKLTIKDYKNYLPNIKHFINQGHLCTSKCAVECYYCYQCAEKIKKVFEKKQEQQRKISTPICFIN